MQLKAYPFELCEFVYNCVAVVPAHTAMFDPSNGDMRFVVDVNHASVYLRCHFVCALQYHHLQYPSKNLEKAKERSHKLMIFGLIPAVVTLYLALEIAVPFTVRTEIAFVLTALPFLLVCILFKKRK